ncbi:MAG: hypothetical protein P3W93_008095 [Thermus sp.]|nr:hypothetical protein [Thermus sp.]
MEVHLVKVANGHVVVAETGLFAISPSAKEAEALGRHLYHRVGLPVVPLVVGQGSGYKEGVLHVESLEGYLSTLPRILTPNDVRALKVFLEEGGERPSVSMKRVEAPPKPGGPPSQGLAQAVSEAPPPPLPSQEPLPWTTHLIWVILLPLVPVALLGPIGFPVLGLALWFVAVQERLLQKGGSAWDWKDAFKGVLWGLGAMALLGGLLGYPPHAALLSGLTWALLPGLYGALALYRPSLPYGGAALLYFLAWADALPWVALLAPLGLLSPYPWLAVAAVVPLAARAWSTLQR